MKYPELIKQALHNFTHDYFLEPTKIFPYVEEKKIEHRIYILVGYQMEGMQPLVILSQCYSFCADWKATHEEEVAVIYEALVTALMEKGIGTFIRIAMKQSRFYGNPHSDPKSLLYCSDLKSYTPAFLN